MSLLCNLTPLLVFLATIGVAFGAPNCYGDEKGFYQRQLPLYEHMHTWMNLTMDCEAVFNAVDAAERHSRGEADTVKEEYWCKYSRVMKIMRNYGRDWLKSTVLREMDWNLSMPPNAIAKEKRILSKRSIGASIRESCEWIAAYY
ncbi:hypothetical protein Q1695_001731 [Nippostrongylus brasiliensis]|nr:hypothetical protein Q1695_001731 [Nippostrongylus brasiliensis]